MYISVHCFLIESQYDADLYILTSIKLSQIFIYWSNNLQTYKRTSFIYKKYLKLKNYFFKSSNNNDEGKVNVKSLNYVFIMY